ncbi:MAG: tetratricopeptide repeat protein [Acidobacteriota bacterium]
MNMWKNPIVTAVAGVLLGFFVGWVVGQGRPAPPTPTGAAADPHAGVPGAPALSNAPQMPPEGGRTAATGNPLLMEQARNLDQLLAEDPKNFQHLVQAGNVQYDMGNFVKAAVYYEKALAIRADSPDVLTDLGVCYRETNQPAKAIEYFDRAADLRPEHWQSRYNAAVVRLFDLNDAEGAQMELEKLKPILASLSGSGAAGDLPDLAGLEQEIAKRRK